MSCFRIVCLIFVTAFISLKSLSQEASHPRLPLSLMHFESEMEAQLFENLESLRIEEQLTLFMLSDSLVDELKMKQIRSAIQNYIVEARGWKKKKPTKEIGRHYKEVHNRFLDKYELESLFREIFEKQTYNCVTATGLFAYIFDNLQIPFEIHEYPLHVNLMAYPETNRILVETTDPQGGFVNYSAKQKRAYAEQMRAQKLISEAEFLQGPEAVFEKHFLDSKPISFLQLAGIQYGNTALYYAEHDEFEKALQLMAKGYNLHQGDFSLNNLVLIASRVIEQPKATNQGLAMAFGTFAHLPHEHIPESFLIEKLEELGKKQRTAKADTSKLAMAAAALLSGPIDSTFSHFVQLVYNYEMGIYFALQEKGNEAMPFAMKALEFDWENFEVQRLCSGVVLMTVDRMEWESGVALLDSLADKFPNLLKIPAFYKMKMQASLVAAGHYFQQRKEKQATQQLQIFESLYNEPNRPEAVPEKVLVEQCFREAFYYYFRLGANGKARKAVDRGLELHPSSYPLQNMRDLVR
jgi:hypothetical protein